MRVKTVACMHAVLGDSLYVVGGGNNVKGCTDLLAVDLAPLKARATADDPPADGSTATSTTTPAAATPVTVSWRVVASVQPRDPLSSEGISLVAVPQEQVRHVGLLSCAAHRRCLKIACKPAMWVT